MTLRRRFKAKQLSRHRQLRLYALGFEFDRLSAARKRQSFEVPSAAPATSRPPTALEGATLQRVHAAASPGPPGDGACDPTALAASGAAALEGMGRHESASVGKESCVCVCVHMYALCRHALTPRDVHAQEQRAVHSLRVVSQRPQHRLV